MELPPIQSFKLNNILCSIQDDSIDQLINSILNLNSNFNNDLNDELLNSIEFQYSNINTILNSNLKLIKNFKHLKPSVKFNIDDELFNSIKGNSERTKELINKLYKLEKLLPSKERLFNESNSHKLHYPLLYGLGVKVLDLNDDVVSLDEVEHPAEQAIEPTDKSIEEPIIDNPTEEPLLDPTDKSIEEDQIESSTPLDHSIEVPIESHIEPLDNSIEESHKILDKSIESIPTESQSQTPFGSYSDDPIQENLQKIYNSTPETSEPGNLKDQRISMLSKNIDDMISERVQQQRLQSITKPTSLIFPTQLTKKTSSLSNEDATLIIIQDDLKPQQVIFGLKKFL